MQDPRFAARAGDAAGIASFLALSAFGRRSSALGRVMPALVVRRHVRQALGQFSAGGGKPKRKRLRVVAGTAVIAALAVGASRRHRAEA
jgi:hypothetical protein